jgi:hypothetical protein
MKWRASAHLITLFFLLVLCTQLTTAAHVAPLSNPSSLAMARSPIRSIPILREAQARAWPCRVPIRAILLERLRGGQDLTEGEDHAVLQSAGEAAGLRIFCGTWNVNGKPPLVPIEDWLYTRCEGDDVDVYVIALQEVQGLSGTAALLTDEEKGRPWSAVLQQAVGAPSLFRCLAVRQMVGCYITLLVRASLCADMSDIKVGELGTGFLNSGGNKGGVAVRFQFRGVSVCAISSHLAAQVTTHAHSHTPTTHSLRTHYGFDLAQF